MVEELRHGKNAKYKAPESTTGGGEGEAEETEVMTSHPPVICFRVSPTRRRLGRLAPLLPLIGHNLALLVLLFISCTAESTLAAERASIFPRQFHVTRAGGRPRNERTTGAFVMFIILKYRAQSSSVHSPWDFRRSGPKIQSSMR